MLEARQEGKGDDAVVHLHYFAGGQANWYITEKDKGSPSDPIEEQGKQHQAYGLADLFDDGGELGYISIEEIIANGGELDLHWKTITLGELRPRRAWLVTFPRSPRPGRSRRIAPRFSCTAPR